MPATPPFSQALEFSRPVDKVPDVRSWVMDWWKKRFGGTSDKPLDGAKYQVVETLYSQDGKRSAEIRNFENGQVYLLESEWIDGAGFIERHEGRMVGPFRSPKHAEQFIVTTEWFRGE
jgi:hypothetical protein